MKESDGEGNTFCSVIMRAAERLGGVLELGMCGHLLHGNREILYLAFDAKGPHAWDLYGGCWVTGIPTVTLFYIQLLFSITICAYR